MSLDRNDAWSTLRREWREASDEFMRKAMEPGWEQKSIQESMARVARLSVQLRLFEQGRRSVR